MKRQVIFKIDFEGEIKSKKQSLENYMKNVLGKLLIIKLIFNLFI